MGKALKFHPIRVFSKLPFVREKRLAAFERNWNACGMSFGRANKAKDLTGCRVIILVGDFAGQEGICVGRSNDDLRWAISPDSDDQILQLQFEKEFGLLIDM